MNRDVWLKPNRRVLILAMAVQFVVAALGATLTWRAAGLPRIFGVVLMIASAAMVLALTLHAARPRLAVNNGQMLVYLCFAAPIEVPLAIVECIFLGRPEFDMETGQKNRMVNLVIRLAESAKDYHAREVKASLGRWADGYITIHGAWCEPLTISLAEKLNARLREAQRQHQQQS